MTEDKRKYTRRELRCLWAGFAGEPDEAERLAGFADCTEPEAAEMINTFRRETAAARRAAAAEEARTKKPRKTKSPVLPIEAEELEISEPFPASDVIAAALNSKHKLSIVEAQALSRDRKRSIIIEVVNHNGERYHRLKVTSYAFFRSREQALQAARVHRMKLTVYDTHK